MENKTRKLPQFLWYLAIFTFFYIWFAKIHPLVVYDADDWTYLAYVRPASPIWGDWNPAKVFPEVMMPFFSTLGLHLLMPIVGDYIDTFTITHAIVVSGFLTLYVWSFAGLVRRVFYLSHLETGLLSALFVVFHFWVLRGQEWNNLYLFHCEDLNCYYNYLIPSLLNASCVMFFLKNPALERFWQDGAPAVKGLFFLLLYLTVFSNLVTSGILAAFAGSCLLLALIRAGKRIRLKAYVKENSLYLLTLVLWFVSAIFELSGGRAGTSSTGKLLKRAHTTLYYLKDILFDSNRLFWVVVFVICAAAVVLFLRARGKGDPEKNLLTPVLTLGIAAMALLVYIALLCAMLWPGYIYRSEYLFGLFFFGFLIVLLALGYVLKKLPKLGIILPLAVVILASTINTNGQTFQESNMSDLPPETCAAISRDILDQLTEADAAGLTEMTLYVPQFVADPESEDNWPHSLVLLHRIPNALYEQGVLKNHITITPVASAEFNQRHGLPIPTEE